MTTKRHDDRRLLTRKQRIDFAAGSDPVAVVDLFSGCGGMTLGAALAAHETGRAIDVRLAVDADEAAMAVYRANFGAVGDDLRISAVEGVFDGSGRGRPTRREREVAARMGPVDILMGGPPCQGHSDLNNHTRRSDPRNGLYSRMARAAVVLRPSFIVIENVPAVRHDRQGVVESTRAALSDAGYAVSDHLMLACERLGVPQARRRHVQLATNVEAVDLDAISMALSRMHRHRTVSWAIEDLVDRAGDPGSPGFDASSRPSAENVRRMEWLFREDAHVLPDSLRPPCHRAGGHSYKSIYGRMSWDAPAQTVTTGFGSMGQGCYVHPKRPRTITPHEAARLQTFPDFFDFSAVRRRTAWAKLIGNAVPPFAMRAIVREFLRLSR